MARGSVASDKCCVEGVGMASKNRQKKARGGGTAPPNLDLVSCPTSWDASRKSTPSDVSAAFVLGTEDLSVGWDAARISGRASSLTAEQTMAHRARLNGCSRAHVALATKLAVANQYSASLSDHFNHTTGHPGSPTRGGIRPVDVSHFFDLGEWDVL